MHDFVWHAVNILTDLFKSKRFQCIESNLLCVNEELCTMPKFLFFVVSLLVGNFFVNILEATRAKGKRMFNFLKFTLFKKSKWRERKRWTRCSVDWKACAVSSVRPLCEMLICAQLHLHTLQFCAPRHSCTYISIWKYVFLRLCASASIEQSAIAKATKSLYNTHFIMLLPSLSFLTITCHGKQIVSRRIGPKWSASPYNCLFFPQKIFV